MSNSKKSFPTPVTEPIKSAKTAGLRYITDQHPGIRRQRRGRGFSYIGLDNQVIRDRAERERIEALAIPPAWTEVWICPWPNGHLQATGRDVKGRKQYCYHPHWNEMRSQTKYGRMLFFAQALPLIRAQIEHDLGLRGLPRRKVLAAIVRLLETTFIRVGNRAYARDNHSFGLTTLRDRHVKLLGASLQFQFRGKSGQAHCIDVKERRLIKIIKQCRDIPGYELFQYIDETGQRKTVDSGDVNAYLREITDQDFTAKDFRTWGGTLLATMMLKKMGLGESESETKQNIVQTIKEVARCLGNRPATCRKYYVHPAVLKAYGEGKLVDKSLPSFESPMIKLSDRLNREEKEMMGILYQYIELGVG